MEALNITRDSVTVTLSTDELVFLANAINETLEALDEWEFPIRTGDTPERAFEIHSQIRKILDEAKGR